MTRTRHEQTRAAVRSQQFVGHANRSVSELARSAVKLARAREQMEADVLAARRAGTSWAVIAGVLAMSTQSAWSQFRHLERADESA